jgi:peptidoglycan/LPS O-acetylase OafA/YrhL
METRIAVGRSAMNDPGAAGSAYRPHLDGLRAVAVYLVVLFHSGIDRFGGGYVGVDVFFVLSGFLVTQLLLRDVTAHGSIRLRRFYARRFRRLLPAAFVALLVTAVVYTAISSALEVSDAVGSFKAAFAYSANWYFIHQSHGYFGADISASPVLHFWSLAVEEQFYLLWPLTLGGLFAVTRNLDSRRRKRTMQIVIAVGALASAAYALSLRDSNLNRAYYGTDTRAYELLAGALLALVPTLVIRASGNQRAVRIATTAGFAGLLVIASSWVHLDPIERGIAVTAVACVILVALEAAQGGFVKWALSSPTVVYLGRISYGTYLWHWIVILVTVKTFETGPVATAAIACLVSSALASLSFEILERPVRTSAVLDRHRSAVIAGGLAISLASAFVVIPKLVDPARASNASARTHGAETRGLTPVPKHLNLPRLRGLTGFRACVHKPVSTCTLVKGPGKHVLLIGDSHAWAMAPMFSAIANREHLHLSVSIDAACPWQRHIYTNFDFAECKEWQDDLYQRVVPRLDPDIIVVVNLAFGTPGKYPVLVSADHHRIGPGTVAGETPESVALLRGDHRDVVIVEPIPLPVRPDSNFDPLACLAKAATVEECRYETRRTPSDLERVYRRIAQHDPKVRSLDLDRSVCPLFPICDPIVGGTVVKWDPSHLTIGFAQSLAPEVDTYLKSIGIIPP